MDAELLTVIISGATALTGALGTTVWTLFKYRDAKKKEKEAEEKEFYLYTASNLVRESERMFGDGKGEDKKQYAMTRIQNEALASKVAWNPKVASLSIEQAVALRNDYKNLDVPINEIIKRETAVTTDVKEVEKELKDNIDNVIVTVGKGAKNIVNTKAKEEKEDSVIGVVEN